jgi:hypothetical protein
MYTKALLTDYRTHGTLAGYCDINQTRMDYYNQISAIQFARPPIISTWSTSGSTRRRKPC